MFGSQTALLASRLGSELPRRGVEVAQRKPWHFHESTKSSLTVWNKLLDEVFVRHLTCEDLFCVWRGALLKPDLGTSASRFAIAMSTKPDLGRPPSQQSDEDEEEPWTVKTNGCWLGMTERITCPSLCFCCLISMYWFTLHCKWTSKGKRAKTNEANEGMTLREEPQWLAEPPFRYCRLGIIWI